MNRALRKSPTIRNAINARLEQLESEHIAEAKERLKAAELLGKVRGLFVTRQEIDLQGAMPAVIRDDL